MTLCDVRHEAGPPADELVAKIVSIADQVVPVLESITDLSVGPRPVIRVITPDAWVEALAADNRRSAQRDIDDLDLTPEQVQQRLERARGKEEELRLIWPLVMGATIEAEDGTPEVLLVPEALRHCGFEEPELIKVVAHELNHVAQHRAGDGAAFLAQRTAFGVLRGLEGVMAAYFLSGHSRWADLIVTTRMIGREVQENTGRQTETYWQVREQVEQRYRHDRGNLPGPPRAAYVEGSQWVRIVVDEVGTAVLNRAWKETSLMPTSVELEDPHAWIARVA